MTELTKLKFLESGFARVSVDKSGGKDASIPEDLETLEAISRDENATNNLSQQLVAILVF